MTPKWLSLDFHMVNVQIKIRWTFPISGRKWRIQSPKSFPSFPIFHANPIPHYLHYLLYIYICNKCIFPVQSQFFMPKASDFSLTRGGCRCRASACARMARIHGLGAWGGWREPRGLGEKSPHQWNLFCLYIYMYVCIYIYVYTSYHIMSYHIM